MVGPYQNYMIGQARLKETGCFWKKRNPFLLSPTLYVDEGFSVHACKTKCPTESSLQVDLSLHWPS